MRGLQDLADEDVKEKFKKMEKKIKLKEII